MSTSLDGGGSFIPRFSIPSEGSTERKREQEREKNVQQQQSHRQSKSRLQEGVKQQEAGHGSPRLARQGARAATRAARAAEAQRGESTIKSMAGEAERGAKSDNVRLSHPQLKEPTTTKEVSGQEIASAMRRGMSDKAGEKANGELLNGLVKFVAKASESGKMPKGMSEEEWARQLADGLLSPNARGAERSEKILQHLLNGAAKSLGKEFSNPEKILNGELNSQKNELNSYKNSRFNGLLDKAIASLPDGEREAQQLMKNNPEFNRFQPQESIAKYKELQQQAMRQAGSSTGALFKPRTTAMDENSSMKLGKFHDGAFDELMRGNISPKQANQLQYILAGKDPALFKGKSKEGESMGELADKLMKQAKESADREAPGSAKATPQEVDQDLERVRSAFRNMKGAKRMIKGELPDADMEKYEQFALHPNKQANLSREERRSFEKAYNDQMAENPTSDLSIKQMKNFEEGYSGELDDMVERGEVSERDAAAVRDPSIAFDEEASLTASQKGLVKALMAAGMEAVKSAPKRHVAELNSSREAMHFLTELPTAARESGLSSGEVQGLLNRFAEGAIAMPELMNRLGPAASKSLRKVEVESGLEGLSFQLDSASLKGAINSIQGNDSMKLKFFAGAFMQEQLAVVKELFKEVLQAGRKGAVTDEMVDEEAAATEEQAATSSANQYFAVSIGAYISVVGSLSTKIQNLLADAQISDIHATEKIETMKTVASLMKRTKDYNALVEQRAQRDQQKGFFGKLFGGISLVFKMTMCVMFAPLIFTPVGPAMLATSIGAWKDVINDSFGEAMNKGFMEQMQSGLAVMVKAVGIENPPDWMKMMGIVYSYAVMTAAVIGLAVVSIIGAPLTGGTSLLATAAFVAMAVGTVMMTVGSVLTLTSQMLNDMAEAGLIDEDFAESMNKIFGKMSLYLSLAGFALCLPMIIYELPNMMKSIAEMGGSAASSAKKMLGLSDDVAKLSGMADDIARAADAAADLGTTSKEMNAAKQFSEAANAGDLNRMADSWGNMSDLQRQSFLDADVLFPDEFRALSTQASQSKAKAFEDFKEAWNEIDNFEDALSDKARLDDLSVKWSKLDDAEKLQLKNVDNMQFLEKLDANRQNMLLDDFTRAVENGDDVAMRNSVAEMNDSTKATAKSEHPDHAQKIDDLDKQLTPHQDSAGAVARGMSDADARTMQNIEDVQKKNLEELEEARKHAQKLGEEQAKAAHARAQEEILDLNKTPEMKPRPLSAQDDAISGLNARDSESFFNSQGELSRASDLETKRAMNRFTKARSVIESIYNTLDLANTIIVERRNSINAKHQQRAEEYMAESQQLQSSIDLFNSTISEISSDQRELSQSISKLSKEMNKFYDGLSRVIQELVTAMDRSRG